MYTRMPRVALAVLSTDLVAEPEIQAMLPDGIPVYVNRVHYPPEVTAQNLAIAEENLEQAVRELLDVRPHVLVWACTSGSFYGGEPGHAALLAKLQSWAPGVHVATASSAVLAAFAQLGVRRLAVGSPYPPEVNVRLREFLAANGYEPVHIAEMHNKPVDDWTLQDITPEQVVAFAEAVNRHDAEAVFISCTGIPAAAIIASAEERIGKPLITSNQAIAWYVMRQLGTAEVPNGKGRLFASLRREGLDD